MSGECRGALSARGGDGPAPGRGVGPPGKLVGLGSKVAAMEGMWGYRVTGQGSGAGEGRGFCM